VGSQARASRVRLLDRSDEGGHRLASNERDRAAAEPGAGEPRAEDARHTFGDLDECVEIGTAHLVQVAERCVALRKQTANPFEVVGVKGLDRREHAFVLLDDVACPIRKRWRQLADHGLEDRRRDVAKASHPVLSGGDRRHRGFALGPSLVVRGSLQTALRA
jgi:hypothetical protein